MSSSTQISIEKRAQVLILKEEGHTHKAMANVWVFISSLCLIFSKDMLKRVLFTIDIILTVLGNWLQALLNSSAPFKRMRVVCTKACSQATDVIKYVRARIAFCKIYKKWRVPKLEKVLFSDEFNFFIFMTSRRFVRRPVGWRFQVKYTLSSVKYPLSYMVWGGFSALGKGS